MHESAGHTFAVASYNHVLNVRLQQDKARAVIALIGQGQQPGSGTPK